MAKSRDKSNRAYTKDKKGRRKYVDSASRYAQSTSNVVVPGMYIL